MKNELKEKSAEPTHAGFTIENPEDYAMAKRRIEALENADRNDDESAEMDGLKLAVFNADFPPTVRTRNNHIG